MIDLSASTNLFLRLLTPVWCVQVHNRAWHELTRSKPAASAVHKTMKTIEGDEIHPQSMQCAWYIQTIRVAPALILVVPASATTPIPAI